MFLTRDQVADRIAQGALLLVSGDTTVLGSLPQGSWIGGSTAYFMGEHHSGRDQNRLQVVELPRGVFLSPQIKSYTASSVQDVAKEAPNHGVSFMVLPFGSQVHLEYARRAPWFHDMFSKPLVGWVSGYDLDSDQQRSIAVNGQTGAVGEGEAVVLHCNLAPDVVAEIGSLNIFEVGSGPTIEFLGDGFEVDDAFVDGNLYRFSDYLVEAGVDTKLPLMGDFYGVPINASIMSVDQGAGSVKLYAPVFRELTYRFAAPIQNHSDALSAAAKTLEGKEIIFACNCILNHLYGHMDGRQFGSLEGPVTFGEIAFQLVNQTLVYLELKRV